MIKEKVLLAFSSHQGFGESDKPTLCKFLCIIKQKETYVIRKRTIMPRESNNKWPLYNQDGGLQRPHPAMQGLVSKLRFENPFLTDRGLAQLRPSSITIMAALATRYHRALEP